MEYPLESIKALNGRIWAKLTEEENRVLSFYQMQGRKYGVAVGITSDVDRQELAQAKSPQEADALLRRASAIISVTINAK